MGARAHAGYLVTDPTVRFGLIESGQASAASNGGGAQAKEPGSSQDGNRLEGLVIARGLVSDLWMGLGQSGAGSSAPSTIGGTGVSGIHAAVVANPKLPPLLLVGRLYLADLDSRPPPFPSRLFRPPRMACC
jgi:hypothetical protein